MVGSASDIGFDAPQVRVLRLRKAADQKVGLVLVGANGRQDLISDVKVGGAVDLHHKGAGLGPDECIQIGDRIVAVNGRREDFVQALREASEYIELEFVRSRQAPAPPPLPCGVPPAPPACTSAAGRAAAPPPPPFVPREAPAASGAASSAAYDHWAAAASQRPPPPPPKAAAAAPPAPAPLGQQAAPTAAASATPTSPAPSPVDVLVIHKGQATAAPADWGPHFEWRADDRYWWCKLCHQVADESHCASKKHTKRADRWADSSGAATEVIASAALGGAPLRSPPPPSVAGGGAQGASGSPSAPPASAAASSFGAFDPWAEAAAAASQRPPPPPPKAAAAAAPSAAAPPLPSPHQEAAPAASASAPPLPPTPPPADALVIYEGQASAAPVDWGPHFEWRAEGRYYWCKLCEQVADESHCTSKRHMKRAEWADVSGAAAQASPSAASGGVPQRSPPPPPLLPGGAPETSGDTAAPTAFRAPPGLALPGGGPALPAGVCDADAEELFLQDFDGVPSWRCRLCDKWADDGHVAGREHREAVRQRKARADMATRAERRAAAGARMRQAQVGRETLMEVRALSPGRRLAICSRVGGTGSGAEAEIELPLADFESWPLEPRVGDQLALARGGQPTRLASCGAGLTEEEVLQLLKAWGQTLQEGGASAACGELTVRYKVYMQWVLEKFDFLGLESGAEAAGLLLDLLRRVLSELPWGAGRSTAQAFLVEAARTAFVRTAMPSLVGMPGRVDNEAALSFALLLAERFPEDLCSVQALIAAAIRARAAPATEEGPGGDTERLLAALAGAGDALARAAGRWDAVSWRKLPAVPAPLSGDLADCAGLPHARLCYSSEEEYLDTMYRLLRANSFLSLQRGIRSLTGGTCENVEMRMYRLTVAGCGLQTHSLGGLVVTASCERLAADSASEGRSARKRSLLFGSLLCISLSPEPFQDVAWGRVFEKVASKRQGVEVVLEFPPDLNVRHGFELILRLLVATGQPLLAAEAPVFFQAHGPVLRVLQGLGASRLPLGRALLGGAASAAAAAEPAPGARALRRRLRRQLEARVDIQPDTAQKEALNALVSRRLAVVQGPPGTGKTFVGLQAAQVFVEAAKAAQGGAADTEDELARPESDCSDGDEDTDGEDKVTGPVVVLCYKNHSLDEFGAKSLRFTENIVRLGGRASEEMAKYNLQAVAAQLPKDRVIGSKLRQAITARDTNRDSIIVAVADLFRRTELVRLVVRRATDEQLKSLVRCCPGTHSQHELLTAALDCGGRNDIGIELFQACVDEWLRKAKRLQRDYIGLLQASAAGDSSEDEEEEEERQYHQREWGSRWAPLGAPRWGGFDATAKLNLVGIEATAERDLWALDPAGRCALVQHWLAGELQEAKAEVVGLLHEDELLGSRIAELERKRSVGILRSADLVCCTITGAAMRIELLREVGFCAAIVEEAAEILEPMLLAALPHTVPRVLLIGDHEQLRPLLEEEGLRDYGLDVSLMERLARQEGFSLVQLKLQNRMRDEIMQLNKDIYPDLRTNHAAVRHHVPPQVLATPGGEGMFFVDTAFAQAERAEGRRGYYNPAEAQLVASHVILFLEEGTPLNKIMVLCAYNRQRAYLRDILIQLGAGVVQVVTIDASQGDENDVVLVSLTRGVGRFLDTKNRRCVAVSRARCCLILYGDAQGLSRTEAWTAPLRLLKEKGLLGPDLPLECPRHSGVHLELPGLRCERLCDATLACGHPCGRRCHARCPPCAVILPATFPRCGHAVDKPCSKRWADMLCKHEVEVKRPACGHDGFRLCHQPEGLCQEPVDITCRDCGKDGRTTCEVLRSRPHDYECPHPCTRKMRCGHPCELRCSANCDDGLDSCPVCREERARMAEERRAEIQAQIQELAREDHLHIADASEEERAEAEHLAKSYFAGAGVAAKLVSAQRVVSSALRRRFLLAGQQCFAPQEAQRVLLAQSEAQAHHWATEGVPEGAKGIQLFRTAEAHAKLPAGPCWILLCRVQLGHAYDCRLPGRDPEADPPDGFDSTYDPSAQCHRVFSSARILPEFIASVEVRRDHHCALPDHWTEDPYPAQGWQVVPISRDAVEFKALALCLRTDPKELNRGVDVLERGSYTKLVLCRAWRIQHPPLWRKYTTERAAVCEEVTSRRLEIPDPKVRAEFRTPLEKLPDPLDHKVNEERLLHGTKPEMVLALLQNGLNERFSGGLFGHGSYLAEDAGKTDQYVQRDKHRGQVEELHRQLYRSEEHPKDVYYLFLCRAVLGCFVATKSGSANADALNGRGKVYATSDRRELAYVCGTSPPVHYHALVAETGEHIHRFREFVVFNGGRIYPEYLLAYQRH